MISMRGVTIEEPLPHEAEDLTIQGTIIYGEFLGCRCPVERLVNSQIAELAMTEILQKYGFGVLETCFHTFPPFRPGELESYTGAIVIAESHLTLHGWPDKRKMNIDLFTCNLDRDNSAATRAAFEEIKAWFDPTHSIIKSDGRY